MRFRMFFCTLSLSVKKLGNVGPVSYTHLDVYKRQRKIGSIRPNSLKLRVVSVVNVKLQLEF